MNGKSGEFQTHFNSSKIPDQPSGLPGDMHPLFADGTNLDPMFLEESWTLGVPAAIKNLQRRRQLKADHENQNRAAHKLDRLGTLHFLEDRQRASDYALADRAATVVDSYNATPQTWNPQDWNPEDRIAQRWIPQGWTPSNSPRDTQSNPIAELCDAAMTVERARLLLEVTPASTREQLRSAYRRMVGQWHPDRLQFTSEAIRNHATRHMAELNEAYRLLCTPDLEQAA